MDGLIQIQVVVQGDAGVVLHQVDKDRRASVADSEEALALKSQISARGVVHLDSRGPGRATRRVRPSDARLRVSSARSALGPGAEAAPKSSDRCA